MELRHLRYFRTVAEEGHITRAAERLSIQQPPLSLQIKALETELQVKLFERLPRGVALTEAGHSFYKDVCAILDRVDEASLAAQRVSRGEEGNIAIGFTSSVIFHKATKQAIQDYRSNFPGIALSLEEDGSSELISNIAENRLDVAFVRTNVAHVPGVAIYELLEEPMRLALPFGHPLDVGGEKPIDLREVSGHPLVLYRRSSGPGLYDRIISAFEQSGISPTVIQEAPRVGSALNLVAVGMGACFVPDSLCVTHPEGVHYRPVVTDPPLVAPIMLACRKSESSQAVRYFVETARKSMSSWAGEE